MSARLFKDLTASSVHVPTALGGRRRRIMRAFRIDEISAVDRPAQAHARILLQKRDDTPVALHKPKEHTEMSYENVDPVKLANFMIECAAGKLRDANPSLTFEQAYSKAYCDPQTPGLPRQNVPRAAPAWRELTSLEPGPNPKLLRTQRSTDG